MGQSWQDWRLPTTSRLPLTTEGSRSTVHPSPSPALRRLGIPSARGGRARPVTETRSWTLPPRAAEACGVDAGGL
eukprot:1823189-Rhodomonas_salina.1